LFLKCQSYGQVSVYAVCAQLDIGEKETVSNTNLQIREDTHGVFIEL